MTGHVRNIRQHRETAAEVCVYATVSPNYNLVPPTPSSTVSCMCRGCNKSREQQTYRAESRAPSVVLLIKMPKINIFGRLLKCCNVLRY